MSSGPDLSDLKIDAEHKHESRRTWPVVLGLVPAVVVVLIVAFWFVLGNRPIGVSTAEARLIRSGESSVLNASGYVTPRRRATVSSKITGKLVEVLIEEGLVVTKGQVLARLDDVDAGTILRTAMAERDVAKSRITELEVELADARRSYRRVEQLFKDEVASQDDFDRAETRVSAAQAGLESSQRQYAAAEARVGEAKRHVDNCVIRSPFSGVVVSKDAQPGEMVSPVSAGGGFTRTGIATIVDMASLEIEVDVNESYIARVYPEQRVVAILDAYPDWSIPASVITVIPTADRQKATVRVRIGFDELDPKILPDMGVRVSFLGEELGAEESLTKVIVPKRAIAEIDGRAYVFIVTGNTVERRAIRIGTETDEEVSITAGLSGGERLVVAPSPSLVEGNRVKIEPIP
jgi:RND family efflux transporter MFP subunit